MSYFLYIIHSVIKDQYYVGHTNDIEERIRKHNSKHKGFTGKENDWRLVYSESYPTKETAYAREREIKKWKSRTMLERLIAKGSEHPDFNREGH